MSPLRLFALLVVAFALHAGEAKTKGKPEPTRVRVQPVADLPLRDASIQTDGSGTWYLTGTKPAADGGFQHNDGIWLWKSSDLTTWAEVGQVWSIERQATAPASAWQREQRVNPDAPRGTLVRGIVSPELCYAQKTWWIAYSMNAQGTGLLKSTSGKAEGPYQDLGRITEQGTDASLFEDGGTLFWLVGQGWIAPLKPDASGLAEPMRLLAPAPFPAIKHGGHEMDSTNAPRYLGVAGAHLFKAEGTYCLTAAAVRDRMGVGCYDTVVCVSKNLMGPYEQPMLMVPHGGQTTVFAGPGGKLMATFAPRDSRAVFRDRPGVVALEFTTDVLYGQGKRSPFPRRSASQITEFGPWASMQKATPFGIRDLQFSKAGDGFYYMTGSGVDKAYAGRIMLFRSRDLKSWEPVEVQFDYLSIPGATEADRKERFENPKNIASLGAKYMDGEIYHIGGTFHLFTSLYSAKSGGKDPVGGGLWLRSTTGKPEGPYAYVDRSPSQNSAFVDDDGTTYIFFNGSLQTWDPKGDKMTGTKIVLKTTSGTAFAKGDVATNLIKFKGKYLIFATGWCGGNVGENYRVDGTYDWVYWQSDKLEGPYEMPRRAYAVPHAGHSCPPVQGPDGRWWGLIFGNDSTGPWNCYPGVIGYDLRLDPDGTVRINVNEDSP